MRQPTVQIDPKLWRTFSEFATKRGKKPQQVLNKLIRNYLEIEQDKTLFREMRHDVRGRNMSDAEAVEFVHQYRRKQRSAKANRNGH